MRACEAGYSLLKFFPAMAAGGPPALQAIASALRPARNGNLDFIPTGGVTLANMLAWKALGCVPAVGGTWLAKDSLVASRAHAAIVAATREALAAWNAKLPTECRRRAAGRVGSRQRAGRKPGMARPHESLLWVDIAGQAVALPARAGGEQHSWPLPEEPGCIGLVAEQAPPVARARFPPKSCRIAQRLPPFRPARADC